jgi:hypothetical protein
VKRLPWRGYRGHLPRPVLSLTMAKNVHGEDGGGSPSSAFTRLTPLIKTLRGRDVLAEYRKRTGTASSTKPHAS